MYGKRLIVMKFGGTSVGNAERFRQCAAIVSDAAKHDRIVVVVSAMAGVTDLIFKTIEAARMVTALPQKLICKNLRGCIVNSPKTCLKNPRLSAANDYIAEVIAQLKNACHALSALRSDISAQTADSLGRVGRTHFSVDAGRLSPAIGDRTLSLSARNK